MKRSKIVRILSLMLVAAAVMAASASAVLAYPKSNNYTYDGTGSLTEDELSSIADASAKLNEKKGARVAVCVVNSVIQVGGEGENKDLETAVKDYARAVFKEWKIGNGVLLLVSKEDKTYWAVQSNSLTDTLTDEKLKSILEEKLDSSFDENLSNGIVETARALDEFLTSALPDVQAEKSTLAKVFGVILKIVLAVAILLIAGYVALVILERRALAKRRRYMEARRREMAARGRNRGIRQNPGRLPRQNGSSVNRGAGADRYIEYSSVNDPNLDIGGTLNRGIDQSSPALGYRRRIDPMEDKTVAFPAVNRASRGSERRSDNSSAQVDRFGYRQNNYR